MEIKLSTSNGDFILVSAYNENTFKNYYNVFTQLENKNDYGDFVGEYIPNFNFETDYSDFVNDFEKWLNDIININKATNNQEIRDKNRIKLELNNLVYKRFNKETLEQELSKIFNGEKITIELGCEDLEYLTDWNYMFTSNQDIIGGDFDIYVLMHKNNRKSIFDGAEFLVTEVDYDFFE